MDNIADIAISGKTYAVKDRLKKMGLHWTGKAWAGTLPLAKIEKLKQFCCHYDLQYTIEGKTIKESRLPRGERPISTPSTGAVMGEGRLQWLIEETLNVEKKRHRNR